MSEMSEQAYLKSPVKAPEKPLEDAGDDISFGAFEEAQTAIKKAKEGESEKPLTEAEIAVALKNDRPVLTQDATEATFKGTRLAETPMSTAGLKELQIKPAQLDKKIETREQSEQRLRMEELTPQKQELLRLKESVQLLQAEEASISRDIIKLQGELDKDPAMKSAKEKVLKFLTSQKAGVLLRLVPQENDLKKKEEAYDALISK
jgi:uncharacterized protein YdcH (DUF465 family)